MNKLTQNKKVFSHFIEYVGAFLWTLKLKIKTIEHFYIWSLGIYKSNIFQ